MAYHTLLLPIKDLYLPQSFGILFAIILTSSIDLVLLSFPKQLIKPNKKTVLWKSTYELMVGWGRITGCNSYF